jgi:hypothetical protein
LDNRSKRKTRKDKSMKVTRSGLVLVVEVSGMESYQIHSREELDALIKRAVDESGPSWVAFEQLRFVGKRPCYYRDADFFVFEIPKKCVLFRKFDDVIPTRHSILHRKF